MTGIRISLMAIFFCYNYGHKAAFCTKFSRKIHEYNGYEKFRHGYGKRLDVTSQNRNRNTDNRFDILNHETECYKCQNFGHISRNCPTKFQKVSKHIYTHQQTQIWKRKTENMKVENCNVALQDEHKIKWIINRQWMLQTYYRK